MLIGIQISPHAILGEGIDASLDFLQESGGINTLMLNTHGYYGAVNGWRKPGVLPADHPHGGALDPGDTRFARPWVMHTAGRFDHLPAGHRVLRSDEAYYGRDVFREIIEAARSRGVRVHGRYLEGWEAARSQHIPGWEAYLAEDVEGAPMLIPCLNRPSYSDWWRETMADVMENYPLDGFFFGYERGTPLPDIWINAQRAYCFCSDCEKRATAMGIDTRRAKEGYRAITSIARIAREQVSGKGTDAPPALDNEIYGEGFLMATLRVLMEYPEIIAWDRMQYLAKDEWERLGAETMKSVRPDALFGAIAHPVDDPFKKARENWHRLPEYADYAVLRAYTEVNGPRLGQFAKERLGRSIFQDFSLDARLAWLWKINALPEEDCPVSDTVDKISFPAEFVETAVKRLRRETREAIPVYGGLGLDIPHPDGSKIPCNGEFLSRQVALALDAGASGFVLCREYEEISAATLRAFRNALEESSVEGDH